MYNLQLNAYFEGLARTNSHENMQVMFACLFSSAKSVEDNDIKSAENSLRLGIIFAEKHMTRDAVVHLLIWLGKLYESVGRRTEALASYSRALKIVEEQEAQSPDLPL